jgi:hypothetical protein
MRAARELRVLEARGFGSNKLLKSVEWVRGREAFP